MRSNENNKLYRLFPLLYDGRCSVDTQETPQLRSRIVFSATCTKRKKNLGIAESDQEEVPRYPGMMRKDSKYPDRRVCSQLLRFENYLCKNFSPSPKNVDGSFFLFFFLVFFQPPEG